MPANPEEGGMTTPRLPNSDHADSHICWCCPVIYDPDDMRVVSAEEYERRAADPFDEMTFLIVHRSEIAEENDATGPIPWMSETTTEGK